MIKSYLPFQVAAFLRMSCALGIIAYHCVVVIPNFTQYFSNTSFIEPDLFSHYPKSPLFWVWSETWIKILYSILILSLFLFGIGFFARIFHLVAIVLGWAFHLANPAIIHEPQQLSNLMLVCLLFVPIQKQYFLYRDKLSVFENVSEKTCHRVLSIMLIYISSYYFFAGLKKLPSEFWRDGTAVGLLLAWDPLKKSSILSDYILSSTAVIKAITWGTLVFELSILGVGLSRFRSWLFPAFCIFHLFVEMSLDVGYFSFALLPWWCLFLLEKNKKHD
jgi:hypothetical protein